MLVYVKEPDLATLLELPAVSVLVPLLQVLERLGLALGLVDRLLDGQTLLQLLPPTLK